MDACCLVRVDFDPTLVRVPFAHTVHITMNVSKWLAIISMAAKARANAILSIDATTHIVTATIADGTTLSADQDDADDDLETIRTSATAVFDALKTSPHVRLAVAFASTTELAAHLSPFLDFTSVQIVPSNASSDGRSVSLTLKGIDHSKSASLRCSRTVTHVSAAAPILPSDHALFATLSYNVHYMTKMLAPAGKRCMLKIAHSTLSGDNVLACRYTIDASAPPPPKRKAGADADPLLAAASGAHTVSCALSPVINLESDA